MNLESILVLISIVGGSVAIGIAVARSRARARRESNVAIDSQLVTLSRAVCWITKPGGAHPNEYTISIEGYDPIPSNLDHQLVSGLKALLPNPPWKGIDSRGSRIELYNFEPDIESSETEHAVVEAVQQVLGEGWEIKVW